MNPTEAYDARLLAALRAERPLLWINPHKTPFDAASYPTPFRLSDIQAAESDWWQFAPLLARLFPALPAGHIESPLLPIPRFQERFGTRRGRWFVKADHQLPIAGSIKARGGIFEILLHARDMAVEADIVARDGDMRLLAEPAARALFARRQITVGSTGNLGMSIGIIAAALGFKVTVHMSLDAKLWKKERLRGLGVTVIEHEGDFNAAVSTGRDEAGANPAAYFVDDERSDRLLLGYATAALELKAQLAAADVIVDKDHPLFVYIPCGVGGSPGGITLGLRHIFGDDAHCFFAEPVGSPSMLVRLAAADGKARAVTDIGLSGKTEADGLAVAQASELVAPLMKPNLAGIFTVQDATLLVDLYRLRRNEGIAIEPSAAAGFQGPHWLSGTDTGQGYLAHHDLNSKMSRASHIVWTTGGAMLPEAEYQTFLASGAELSRQHPLTESGRIASA